ncbi:MAG: hypothetical protein ACK41D_01110 [Rubricoccaceae bacterium]
MLRLASALLGTLALAACDTAIVGFPPPSGSSPPGVKPVSEAGVSPDRYDNYETTDPALVCKDPRVTKGEELWGTGLEAIERDGTARAGEFDVAVSDARRALAWRAAGDDTMRLAVLYAGTEAYVYRYSRIVAADARLAAGAEDEAPRAIRAVVFCYVEKNP